MPKKLPDHFLVLVLSDSDSLERDSDSSVWVTCLLLATRQHTYTDRLSLRQLPRGGMLSQRKIAEKLGRCSQRIGKGFWPTPPPKKKKLGIYYRL